MAMQFTERLLTIVITATVVSAGWIFYGVSLDIDPRPGTPEPAPTAASAMDNPSAIATFAGETSAPPRETVHISEPDSRQTATLMIPVLDVSAAQLTDNFSDEGSGAGALHQALDIMAPAGTSVVAAAPGTIEKLFRSAAGGNTIYVRSNDRETIHYYAQMGEYAPGLREGQKIRRGQRLGTVGSTGNGDPAAPHLHFAILRTTPDAQWWEPSTALNPYSLLTVK